MRLFTPEDQHVIELDDSAPTVRGAEPAPIIIQTPAERRSSSLGRKLLVGGLAVGAGIFGVNQLEGCSSDLSRFFGNAVPHPTTQSRIMAGLSRVTLPAEVIAVSGEGTVDASTVSEDTSSGVPVVSWLWNETAARLTKDSSSVNLKGAVQIIVPQNGIQLSYDKRREGKQTVWGIEATVDSSSLKSQVAKPGYQYSNGQPEANNSSGLLAKATHLVESGNSDVTTSASLTDWGYWAFNKACGNALIEDIPAGVKEDVQASIASTANGLAEQPGEMGAVGRTLLKAANHIRVNFRRLITAKHNQMYWQPVQPYQLTLQAPMVNGQITPPKNLNITDSCWFTGDAVRQQEKVLVESATVTGQKLASGL